MSGPLSAFSELVYPRVRTARVLLDNSAGLAPLAAPLVEEKLHCIAATVSYPAKVQLLSEVVDQSGSPPVLLGGVVEQLYTLQPGSTVRFGSLDLQQLRVVVPPGAKVYIELVWEE